MRALKKPKAADYLLLILAIVLAVIFLYPVLFALMSAFKSNGDILKNPVAFPTSLYTQNFVDLFQMSDFSTAIVNTVILTVVSELLIVCIVPMAAYAIERRKSRFTSFIYTFFLAGMMIPFHLYMFPLFKEMKIFGLFGNMLGPIVCYISGSVAFGTLLYCSFLKGIPLDIEEAAMIDGCSPFQTFWKVTFPLLGPCTGSMVILNGLNIWNDCKDHHRRDRQLRGTVHRQMGYRVCRNHHLHRTGVNYLLYVSEVLCKGHHCRRGKRLILLSFTGKTAALAFAQGSGLFLFSRKYFGESCICVILHLCASHISI